MTLSELEKLAQEDMLGGTVANLSALAEADPAGVLTLCTTFREMLEALQCCRERLDGYDDVDRNWLNDIIKEAEEML